MKNEFYWQSAPSPVKMRYLDWAKGDRVLDIGTGSGFYAQELVRRGYAVTAVDVAPKPGLPFPVVRARLSNLPFDDPFDTVLAFDVLEAGVQAAGDIPVVIINEPVFISEGENSDVRYNFYYPRWAYDFYRQELQFQAAGKGWYYVDLWDALPATEFTDSAIHYTPLGSRILAQDILGVIEEFLQEP